MGSTFTLTDNLESEIKNGRTGFTKISKIPTPGLHTIETLCHTYPLKALDLDTLLKKFFIINLILILRCALLLMEKTLSARISICLKIMLLTIWLIWRMIFLMMFFNASEKKKKIKYNKKKKKKIIKLKKKKLTYKIK